MPAKLYPTHTFEQARRILAAWRQIESGKSYGNITPELFDENIEEVSRIMVEINALEAQLTDLRNQRDTRMISLWDKVKRIRSGIKANYGDDSSQYEMVGGTRSSERKSPVRRKTFGG